MLKSATVSTIALALLNICNAHAQTGLYHVVDVQAARATGDPAQWVQTIKVPAEVSEATCDVLVAGAGMGRVAASIRASRGLSVCITDPTDWIGGQATAGGVFALDENRIAEPTGGTRSYYEFRNRIRDHYRSRYSLSAAVVNLADFNPGGYYVSALCFEPRVGVQRSKRCWSLIVPASACSCDPRLWTSALKAERSSLHWFGTSANASSYASVRVSCSTQPNSAISFRSRRRPMSSSPKAAAIRENLKRASRRIPRACRASPIHSESSIVQARIDKPLEYERFRDGQPFSFRLTYSPDLGWKGPVQYAMFGDDPPVPNIRSPRPFFPWRRPLARKNLTGPSAPPDVALMDWHRQDFHDESLVDRTPQGFARVLQQAKRVSFAFLYWLQTDVVRDDLRGKGYPELVVRPDAMLVAFFGFPAVSNGRPAREAWVMTSIERGWMTTDHPNWFHENLPFYWWDWREDKLPHPLPALQKKGNGPVTRRELAERLSGT